MHQDTIITIIGIIGCPAPRFTADIACVKANKQKKKPAIWDLATPNDITSGLLSNNRIN